MADGSLTVDVLCKHCKLELFDAFNAWTRIQDTHLTLSIASVIDQPESIELPSTVVLGTEIHDGQQALKNCGLQKISCSDCTRTIGVKIVATTSADQSLLHKAVLKQTKFVLRSKETQETVEPIIEDNTMEPKRDASVARSDTRSQFIPDLRTHVNGFRAPSIAGSVRRSLGSPADGGNAAVIAKLNVVTATLNAQDISLEDHRQQIINQTVLLEDLHELQANATTAQSQAIEDVRNEQTSHVQGIMGLLQDILARVEQQNTQFANLANDVASLKAQSTATKTASGTLQSGRLLSNPAELHTPAARSAEGRPNIVANGSGPRGNIVFAKQDRRGRPRKYCKGCKKESDLGGSDYCEDCEKKGLAESKKRPLSPSQQLNNPGSSSKRAHHTPPAEDNAIDDHNETIIVDSKTTKAAIAPMLSKASNKPPGQSTDNTRLHSQAARDEIRKAQDTVGESGQLGLNNGSNNNVATIGRESEIRLANHRRSVGSSIGAPASVSDKNGPKRDPSYSQDEEELEYSDDDSQNSAMAPSISLGEYDHGDSDMDLDIARPSKAAKGSHKLLAEDRARPTKSSAVQRHPSKEQRKVNPFTSKTPIASQPAPSNTSYTNVLPKPRRPIFEFGSQDEHKSSNLVRSVMGSNWGTGKAVARKF